MPDWALWLLIWWAGWFLILLTWYERNKKEPLNLLTCFFMFAIAGFMIPYGIIFAVKKLTRKEK